MQAGSQKFGSGLFPDGLKGWGQLTSAHRWSYTENSTVLR